MNLLPKTTLYYITVSLFTFFISGIVIYKLVKQMEERKVYGELNDHMIRLSHDLSHIGDNFNKAVFISGGLVQIEQISPQKKQIVSYSDTLIFNVVRKPYTPYKRISFIFENKREHYRISIYKLLVESNYLIEQIALTITVIVMIF